MNDRINTATNTSKKTPGMAVTGVVLGAIGIISAIFCIGPLFSIPAVICGHKSRSKILGARESLQGEGIALAGLITGYIGIAIFILIIPLLAAIAIPNFISARNKAMEAACTNNLRQIDHAKETWSEESGKIGSAKVTKQDISVNVDFDSFKCAQGGIYTINILDVPPDCSIHGNLKLLSE